MSILRFFGRTMFFGIGGLMVSPFTIAMSGANVVPLVWASVCVIWVLLGMVGRTVA